MLAYVVGASGSGKSAVAPHLRAALAGWAVFDWDAFLASASAIAGKDVRLTPSLWVSYDGIISAAAREVVRSGLDCVVLGVRTPPELADWPVDSWLLLDCSDDERRSRLESNGRETEVAGAVEDAARYRSLGLRTLDTSALALDDVAERIAATLGLDDARSREI